MTDSNASKSGASPDVSETTNESLTDTGTTQPDRRDFMDKVSTVAMAGGLIASYGTFASFAGRYLYPTGDSKSWMFVSVIDEIPPGSAINFKSPAGEKVLIRRMTNGPTDEKKPETEFLALSSTCPHLGCVVHWEGQNNRFFCPCHSGVFDPDGKAIGGPPGKDGQHLPKYALRVEGPMLFIKMDATKVGIKS